MEIEAFNKSIMDLFFVFWKQSKTTVPVIKKLILNIGGNFKLLIMPLCLIQLVFALKDSVFIAVHQWIAMNLLKC